MKNYRLTFLNGAAALFLAGVLITTIIKYPELAKGEGWGIVAMVGLAGIGGFALLIDFVLQLFIKNKKTVNILGLIIVLIFAILFLIDS
jgi:membrane-anchored protein YejM (alkaline phosphatase superfamily)